MSCYCHTCERPFSPLGIAGHRAMHRRRREDCEITYSNGNTYLHDFTQPLDRIRPLSLLLETLGWFAVLGLAFWMVAMIAYAVGGVK